ncbi:hypothetical protein EBQ90_01475 [bacterium]|nr:hypothetical protein [bacterium]
MQDSLMTNDYQRDYELAQSGGYFDLSDWGVIGIEGPDSKDFLQRLSTVNLKTMEDGQLAPGAFLTGRGTVVVIGNLLRVHSERYLWMTAPNQRQLSLEHFEKFHFQERLVIKDCTENYALVGFWNKKPLDLQNVWVDAWRPSLYWHFFDRHQQMEKFQNWEARGLARLGMQLFHFFRVQAGVPWLGWELSESELVLEAGLEKAVARNKGCYPGQEVVERIFTYGQVNKKLLRVSAELTSTDVSQAPDLEISQGTEKMGQLKSILVHPQKPSRGVGLAYIKKSFWENDEAVQISPFIRIRWYNSSSEVLSHD